MITVVGMGCEKDDVTLRGQQAVQKAAKVVIRTAKTAFAATLDDWGVAYISCDDLYDQAADFDALAQAVCQRLLDAGECVYCVDGNGVQDAIVQRLLSLGAQVQVVAGVSPAAWALAQCPTVNGERVHALCAAELLRQEAPEAPDATLVVQEIDDKFLAGEVKLLLLDIYGDVEGFLCAKGKAESVLVSQLDRQKGYGAQCCYVLPRVGYLHKQRFAFYDLVQILARLRRPDGCDWDKVQTHESIRDCCIEEAYELVEAIDLNDVDKMQEETGDVLLQAVFHTAMAQSAGEFTFADMISAVCLKLLTRHPHVFGNVQAHNPEEALAAWDAAKAQEKHQVTYTQKMREVAPMPALMRCKKVQKIASKAHYDFDSLEQAAGKIDEELQELLHAATPEEQTMEGGDLLFSAVNVLRLMHIEPELALLQSLRKFMERFAAVEEALARQGKKMEQCSADELWAVYDAVKERKA